MGLGQEKNEVSGEAYPVHLPSPHLTTSIFLSLGPLDLSPAQTNRNDNNRQHTDELS